MIAVIACALGAPLQAQSVRVGSKNFTEQFVVAQIYATALARGGLPVTRRLNLGSTMVAHAALLAGEIDLYPEYTGTALANVVKPDGEVPAADVYARVKRYYADRLGLTLLAPSGINSGYVLVVRRETADRYHLKTLSDLAKVAPQLTFGAYGEFGDRADGLPALHRVYGMQFRSFRKFLSKPLIFSAIASRDVDVTSAYGTDWQLAGGSLVALDDDKQVFPPYFLTPIVRRDALAAHPQIATILNRLAPELTNTRVQAMNAAVENDHQDPAAVAVAFLDGGFRQGGAICVADGGCAAAQATRGPLRWAAAHLALIGWASLQHLALALAAVGIATLVAAPLAVACVRRPRLYAAATTIATGVFVIPSLALFAVLIPILGLGVKPALAGLSAYCVLLLLRNIVLALRNVPPELIDVADGLGFSRTARLWQVELPLATPLLLSGLRVAIVSAIGIATVAAFIDAGGLGTIILDGVNQNDTDKVIAGGAAAAALAFACDRVLGRIEHRLSRWRRAG